MLAAILVVALGLRVWSLRHGLPFVFNVDEEQHFVSKAARFFAGGDLDPGYFENPPGLTYLLWVAFAVRYAGEDVRSLFHNDPGGVYLTGRLVVARARHRRRRRHLLARLAPGARPPRRPGRGRPDGRRLHPGLVLEAGPERHAGGAARRRSPSCSRCATWTRDAAATCCIAGLMAGLAAGTKYTAGAAFLAVDRRRRAAPDGAAPRGAGRARRRRAAQSVVRARTRSASRRHALAGRALGGRQGGRQRAAGAALLPRLVHLGPRAAGGAAGRRRAWCWRRGRVPRRLAVAAVPALVLLIAISLFDRAFARWALPAYPLVASLAGLAVARGAARAAAARRSWPPSRACWSCIPGVIASVHLNRVLSRTDTRLEAAPVTCSTRRRRGDADRDRADAAVAAHDRRARRQAVLGAGARLRRAAAAGRHPDLPRARRLLRRLPAHLPRADGGPRPGARPTPTTRA